MRVLASARIVGGLRARRGEQVLRRVRDNLSAGDVEARHEGLGEGQERGRAAGRRADLEQIAAAKIRHRHDGADRCAGAVLDRESDQVGEEELVLVLCFSQAFAGVLEALPRECRTGRMKACGPQQLRAQPAGRMKADLPQQRVPGANARLSQNSSSANDRWLCLLKTRFDGADKLPVEEGKRLSSTPAGRRRGEISGGRPHRRRCAFHSADGGRWSDRSNRPRR